MSSRTAADLTPSLLKQYQPFQSLSGRRSSFTTEEAKATANAIAQILKTRFSASRVMLFGSLARDDFHKWSDIDLAVWGVSAEEYFRAVAFASGFSEEFKVDLVDAEDCADSLLQHILREGVEL